MVTKAPTDDFHDGVLATFQRKMREFFDHIDELRRAGGFEEAVLEAALSQWLGPEVADGYRDWLDQ